MKIWDRHKVTILLIFGSLILLLAFLSNWLHAAYQDEKITLKKEIDYAFKDIIGSIEDSLFQNVFLNQVTVQVVEDQSKAITFKKMAVRIDSSDIIKHGEFVKSDTVVQDSSVQLIIRTDHDPHEIKTSGGLLPILINWQSDSLHTEFGLQSDHATQKIVDLVSKQFVAFMEGTKLPKSYEIKRFDEKPRDRDVVSYFYSMPGTSTSYGAVFKDYHWYLLGKMKHQIVICLFLFGAISLTYIMIYRNWRNQQKLIEIKNDFISNVTHELKTPISTVSVALEALSDFDVLEDKNKTKEYLNISKQELTRLNILVDKVLKMSIFEKSAARLNIEKLAFDQVLDQVLNSMRIKFEQKKAKITKQYNGSDFTIDGDKIHLTNVIYNLVDNALKYSTNVPIIDICLEESNGAVKFLIKDQGIGISKENQEKIFNRFFRVSTGDKHNIKGHGLGLSYVASVIKKHGGKIDLKSEIDKGSSFEISLNKNYHEN